MISSAQAVLPQKHRVRIYKTLAAHAHGHSIGWSIGGAIGEGIWGMIQTDQIPLFLRSHVEDWIAEARSEARWEGAMP